MRRPIDCGVSFGKTGVRFWGLSILGSVVLIVLGAGCATVPVTGRQQLAFIPNSQLASLIANNYREVLKKQPLSSDAEATARLN